MRKYLIATIGCLLSVLAFFIVQTLEQKHLNTNFIENAQKNTEIVEKNIQHIFALIPTIANSYNSSNPHLLKFYSDSLLIGWLPKIIHAERDKFEAENSPILAKDNAGNIITAPTQKNYFPLLYKINTYPLGFDFTPVINSLNQFQPDKIQIYLVNKSQYNLFYPIYNSQQLQGFIFGILYMEPILKNILPNNINFQLIDETSQQILFTSHTDLQPTITTKVHIAKFNWTLIYNSTGKPSILALVILLNGFLYTFFFVLYTTKSIKYTKCLQNIKEEHSQIDMALRLAEEDLIEYSLALEAQVAQRTQELNQQNKLFQQEIYDRERIEGMLREKEEFLRLVINNIPQLVFWKDINGVYLGCNKVFAKFFAVDDIIGKTDADLIPEQAKHLSGIESEIIANNSPIYHLIETISQNNNKRWIETNKIPLHDTSGKVIGILGTSEDITERQEYKQTLELEVADSYSLSTF